MENYMETPEIVMFIDVEKSKLMVEISLVAVEKEDISLMMDENGYFLSAPAEGGVDYVAAISFPRAVKPSEAKAIFKDGYLKIEIPFKDPLKNYVNVPVTIPE
jgi:HSP20 family molecular chaperone IbpA